jgi:hypothetical protein
LKQNFSKQVFGYFLVAKSDKEKKITEKMEVVKRDFFVMRWHSDGFYVAYFVFLLGIGFSELFE